MSIHRYQGKLSLLRAHVDLMRGTVEVRATTTRPKITVTADGEGVVSHAGSRLLADVADRTTLTGELSQVLAGLCKPRTRHEPGRVLVDMAVAVADGATTISEVAVLADRQDEFVDKLLLPLGIPDAPERLYRRGSELTVWRLRGSCPLDCPLTAVFWVLPAPLL